MNVAKALRKIQADLERMAREDDASPFNVGIAARQIGAQAEALEKGLAE
jgi:peptide deformylase